MVNFDAAENRQWPCRKIMWRVKDPLSAYLAWVLLAKLKSSERFRIARAQGENWASKLPTSIGIRLHVDMWTDPKRICVVRKFCRHSVHAEHQMALRQLPIWKCLGRFQLGLMDRPILNVATTSLSKSSPTTATVSGDLEFFAIGHVL
ncbi:hypothetical protein TNCV_2552461 [Trichonephila clavipes]|nr:hypothetical protein TNCV_2552461 [Trichonephila clavipes]